MEDLRLRLARASAGYILQGGLAIASRLFGRVVGPPIPVCTVPRDLHGLRLFRSRAGWSEKRSSAGLSRGDSLRQVRYIFEVLVRIVFFVPRGSKLFCPLQNVLRPLRVTPHLGNREKEGQWLSHRRFCGVAYLGLAKAILNSFDRNRNRENPTVMRRALSCWPMF